MPVTTVFGSVLGFYAVVRGVLWLLAERKAMRQGHRPARRGPVVVGIIGIVLGAAMLVFTALIVTGAVR